MLIFESSNWLFKIFNQSECFKISIAIKNALKSFIETDDKSNHIDLQSPRGNAISSASQFIVLTRTNPITLLSVWRLRNKVSWQWLWLSWQSGHFPYQRSAVRIQSLARFYNEHIYCMLLQRRK